MKKCGMLKKKILLLCIISMGVCGCKNKETKRVEVSVQETEEIDHVDIPTETERKNNTECMEVSSEHLEETTEKPAAKNNTEEIADIPQEDETEYSEDTEQSYEYVALGNSVTCNDISDLWWGNWGMAATEPDKDYAHIVSTWLSGQMTDPVTLTEVDLKRWELSSDRKGVLNDYDTCISEMTDLITIQTGENITDNKADLYGDYSRLIEYLKNKAPNAQIFMLGELLWPSDDIETAKKQVCIDQGIMFIDTGEFLQGYDGMYRSSLGTNVLGVDGQSHVIDNEVVAAHPNDEGMACIAQLIINNIK